MAIFPASASKTSNAAAVVTAVSVVVIALVGAVGLAVIVLAVVAALAEVALADSEVGAAGADDNNLGLGFASNFSYNQNLNQPTENKHMKKL